MQIDVGGGPGVDASPVIRPARSVRSAVKAGWMVRSVKLTWQPVSTTRPTVIRGGGWLGSALAADLEATLVSGLAFSGDFVEGFATALGPVFAAPGAAGAASAACRFNPASGKSASLARRSASEISSTAITWGCVDTCTPPRWRSFQPTSGSCLSLSTVARLARSRSVVRSMSGSGPVPFLTATCPLRDSVPSLTVRLT
jgi:hypothetical protein